MPEPWGWWMKAKPDQFGNFRVDDLPPETFEPPASPKGGLRVRINYLAVKIQKSIDAIHAGKKKYKKLAKLVQKALKMAPSELEYLICAA